VISGYLKGELKMRQIKVSASFGGKIPTGSYQNSSPSFFAEETIEFNDELQDVNSYIKGRQQALQEICYNNFEAEALKAKLLKIKNDRADFRFTKLPNGEEVPSVTTILGYDFEAWIDDEEMKQYCAQGTVIHAQVADFINTKVWKEPKEILDITAELFILKNGSLKLPIDGWSFEAFLKKYPITNLKNGKTSFNEQYRYGGTPDGEGEIDNLATLFDVKRTPDKVKNFMQMSAYCKCKGMEHIKQMMIIPLNDKTEQGFSKPIISTDIDKYFELFMAKRRDFRKIYGI
jgi:hypothetical protein